MLETILRLDRRTWWIVLFLLGVASVAPSLLSGFLLDDFIYLEVLEGRLDDYPPTRSLFAFFPGDEETLAAQVNKGFIPWWVWDGLKITFFRPLSAGLWRLDHAVFGDQAVLYHLHSLLWWALLLAAVGALLRQVLPAPVAVLAFALFALDESHVIPAAWISNRNALVALAPAMLGLLAHIRWRTQGWRPGQWLAAAGLATGLCGGETGLAGFAYLFAYELLAKGSLRQRVRALVPAAVILATYAVVYQILGHGSSGSGLYIDPMAEPMAYLAAALIRAPILLAGALSGFVSDLSMVAPALTTSQVVVGALASCCTVALLVLSWPRLEESTQRAVLWLAVGSLLALLPAVATFQSDRLLLGPAVGLCVILSVIMEQGWQVWRARRCSCYSSTTSNAASPAVQQRPSLPRPVRTLLVVTTFALAGIHLLWAPLYGLLIQAGFLLQARTTETVATTFEADPERDLVILNAPDHVVAIYLPLIKDYLRQPVPRSWRVLSLAPYDLEVTRTDTRTLEVRLDAGEMMESLFEKLYRSSSHQLVEGELLDRGLLCAEILATGEHGPTHVRFLFDRSLDDPGIQLAVWRENRLEAITTPAVGTTVQLRRTLGPAGF